jgi:hypothetical protein
VAWREGSADCCPAWRDGGARFGRTRSLTPWPEGELPAGAREQPPALRMPGVRRCLWIRSLFESGSVGPGQVRSFVFNHLLGSPGSLGQLYSLHFKADIRYGGAVLRSVLAIRRRSSGQVRSFVFNHLLGFPGSLGSHMLLIPRRISVNSVQFSGLLVVRKL